MRTRHSVRTRHRVRTRQVCTRLLTAGSAWSVTASKCRCAHTARMRPKPRPRAISLFVCYTKRLCAWVPGPGRAEHRRTVYLECSLLTYLLTRFLTTQGVPRVQGQGARRRRARCQLRASKGLWRARTWWAPSVRPPRRTEPSERERAALADRQLSYSYLDAKNGVIVKHRSFSRVHLAGVHTPLLLGRPRL